MPTSEEILAPLRRAYEEISENPPKVPQTDVDPFKMRRDAVRDFRGRIYSEGRKHSSQFSEIEGFKDFVSH